MRALAIIGLAGILVSSPVLGEDPSQRSPGPVASIENGAVRGVDDGETESFRGLPYAAAPVGDLRWKRAEPAANWSGVRDATRFASKCIQESWTFPVRIVGSEDCLYLNVTRPKQAAAKLPVLVWFHGGGWVGGSSQDIDGRLLAEQGLIVVSVNYRLGALGFYASSDLDQEYGDGVSGNLAQRDQQFALRWVQRNIAALGGDPRRVTISGQSAGSLSNWIHLVSPGADGLFIQMIGESPVVSLRPEAKLDDARGVGGTRTLAEEEAQGASAHLAERLGCANAANRLACLRAIPAADVVTALKPGVAGWGVGWGPVVDGSFLPDAVPTLFREGKYKRYPILTGGNLGENSSFSQRKMLFGDPFMTAEAYTQTVLALPRGADILARYPAAKFRSPEDAYNVMRADARVCINIDTAQVLSKFSPFYVYQFEDPHPPATIYDVTLPDAVPARSYHTAEIPFVFGRGYPSEQHPGVPPFTEAQRRLASAMQRDWAAFVKTGKPGSASGWRPYDQSSAFQHLVPGGGRPIAGADLGVQHDCAFWTKALNQVPNP